MPPREAGDAIDVGIVKGLGKPLGVEVSAYVGDVRGGMKVEMNLSEWQVVHGKVSGEDGLMSTAAAVYRNCGQGGNPDVKDVSIV
jgi:hypothetical protein